MRRIVKFRREWRFLGARTFLVGFVGFVGLGRTRLTQPTCLHVVYACGVLTTVTLQGASATTWDETLPNIRGSTDLPRAPITI